MPPPRSLLLLRRGCVLMALLMAMGAGSVAQAEVLWSDVGSRVIHNTPDGTDILGGAVERDDKSSDALYFKFHVDPLSDAASEPYYAVFQLFEGNEPRLAVGNAPEAWGYSAWYASEMGPENKLPGEFNLKSARPEAAGMGVFKPYELPSHNREQTIVFRVQYIPGGDDLVTVWLNPHLSHGDTAENQPAELTTKFKANASFNQIRLRHASLKEGHDGGNGWVFSDMAIATSFSDFVIVRFWQTWWFVALTAAMLLGGVVVTVRVVEKRKYQLKLRQAEQERALERERARIAQDLHDDLGSSLARISLLSSLARDDLEHPEQVLSHVTKIAQSADETVRALEEIVWAIRPGSDSLQSLVEYIAHFSNELFEGNGTRCRLDLPHDLPSLVLPPEVRHNIFLVVKEALTNVLKHAGAQEVRVQAKATVNQLEILVQDNGQGFDPRQSANNAGTRDGLVNMRRRAEAMGGVLTVESTPTGTTVRLVVQVAKVARKADS
jgi:signal transduction histidine kinase